MTGKEQFAKFYNLTDLVSQDNGGEVIVASDDFFAAKENIIKPGRGKWDPELFSETGKVYDGWESRRKRGPGNDWVIIKLGSRGRIKAIDIDTNHFLGNAPQFASVEGIDTVEIDIENTENLEWVPILHSVALYPGSQNLFISDSQDIVSHIRLQIYPDGGVARLRAYGSPEVQDSHETEVDYASKINGGKAVIASDMYFGDMNNLIKPTLPKNMGEGWETRRRRGPGYDWVIIELGRPIVPQRIEVDTMHYKGNYPDKCTIETCFEPDLASHKITSEADWKILVADLKLHADTNHELSDFEIDEQVTHVKLNIYPDGGVARLRVYG